jgi:tol-pal system protein YbgF
MTSVPDTSAGAPVTTPPQASGPINLQTKFLYDNAYLDLNRGDYALALVGFRDFLSRDPQSDLADNAQYWIAECFYAQRDFPRAIEEFARVEQSYPQGDKVPAAILKTAYALLQIDDRDSARSVLEDLINRFPTSNEAAQARTKLQSLE